MKHHLITRHSTRLYRTNPSSAAAIYSRNHHHHHLLAIQAQQQPYRPNPSSPFSLIPNKNSTTATTHRMISTVKNLSTPSPPTMMISPSTTRYGGTTTTAPFLSSTLMRYKSTVPEKQEEEEQQHPVGSSNDTTSSSSTTNIPIVRRRPIVQHAWSSKRTVPSHIDKPLYADTGIVEMSHNGNEYCVLLFDEEAADRMRKAARIARKALRVACDHAQPGVTTDQIDAIVHDYIIAQNGYPSPLNYAGFPKSLCSSINEIICHGIPDMRPLEFGDVVSFDVSCFYDGVHGDNCATMIVGDQSDDDMENPLDCWRGIPIRTEFATDACRVHFEKARRLVRAAYETLNNAIAVVRPGGCLSDIGAACQETVDKYGYQSVTKYRGHGISSDFHIPPFVKHYQNDEVLRLEPGMIFTIEPMITEFSNECFEWESDGWTVSTTDYGLAAQFEHTVLVTETGVEILTVDDDKDAFPRQAAN